MSKTWPILKLLLQKSAAILAVLAIWEMLPRLGLVSAYTLPPFTVVLLKLVHMLANGELSGHIAVSMARVFWGFALSVAVAVPLGFLLGWSARAERILDALLQLSRNTAPLALYPLFILFFGLGEFSKVAIIFWGAVWPTLINTIEGVRGVDPLLVKSARSMGISQPGMFIKVILPYVFPTMLTGIRLSASRAVIILVAAEMMGADSGLGYLIFFAENNDLIPEMYTGIITLIGLGLLINSLLVAWEKRSTRWKEGTGEV